MTKRILLCDDEIHILRATEFKLMRAGYEVQCAGDGEEGWAMILRFRPHLLITDCQMPRLDGFGLCRRVREHPETRDLAILMLTAKGFELRQSEVTQQWNVLKVISKPFSPRELLRHVEQALEPQTGEVATTAG